MQSTNQVNSLLKETGNQGNLYHQYDESYKFKNPFFTPQSVNRLGSKEKTEVRFLKNLELKQLYPRLLVICQKNEITNTNYLIMEDELTFRDLEECAKSFTLLEVPFNLMTNLTHHKYVNRVADLYLLPFNHNRLELNENELVLPLAELREDKLKIYIKQYGNFKTLPEFYNIRVMNDYYNNYSRSPYVKQFLSSYLMDTKESQYWTIFKNTHLNMTEKFLERDFMIGSTQKMTDEVIKRIAEKLVNMAEDGGNYLQHIYKRKEYTDAVSAIKQRGFILYYLPKPENYKFTTTEINKLYDMLKFENEKVDLLNSLALSKEYCHLLVNNKQLLDIAKPILSKYASLFRYTLGYAWTCMYTEECIKKTYTNEQDRFVFKLDTTNSLPYFPFSYEEPKKTPYLPILVCDKFLDSNTNAWGVVPSVGREFKTSSQEEFKKKLNIFTTGDVQNDLFQNLNWNNLAISGSVIPACVPKLNPLQELFDEPDSDKQFFRYINEYYCDSDIDMMINIQDKFKFYDKVHEVFNTIRENVLRFTNVENLNLVKLEPNYKVAIFINRNFIMKNLVPKLGKTVDELLQDLNTDEIKQIVYPKYILAKMEENSKFSDQLKEKYPIYFKPGTVDQINIYYFKTKKEIAEEIEENKIKIEKEIEKQSEDIDFQDCDEFNEDQGEPKKIEPEKLETEKEEFNDDHDDSSDMFIKDTHKFKITSILMNHSIEIFPTRYEQFFSTVARFHLPCVRGYYNGKETFLLPSCVSAMMTMINIDYKYFAGSKDPIEIINKYRNRGFGTFLNDKEKIKMVEYNYAVEKWKTLYNLKKKNKVSIDNMFGAIDINHDFFKPRKVLSDRYYQAIPVLDNYKKLNFEPIVRINNDNNDMLFKEYQKQFELKDSQQILFKQLYVSTNFLKQDGYIKTVDKWMIEYGKNMIQRLF